MKIACNDGEETERLPGDGRIDFDSFPYPAPVFQPLMADADGLAAFCRRVASKAACSMAAILLPTR